MKQDLTPRYSRRIRLGIIPLALLAFVSIGVRAYEEASYAGTDTSQIDKLTTEELHTLVAPVALYPDALLAQLLPASTFPTEVVEAYRYTQTSDSPSTPPENTSWDSSVIALLHYSPVLKKLNDDVTWMEQLGFAVTYQMEDVSRAIQQVRSEAQVAGHLVSNDKQNVVVERNIIQIVPSDPQVIYVPSYDPYYISDRYYDRPFYSWGVGFGFGLWLGGDFDWHNHRIWRRNSWNSGGWNSYRSPSLWRAHNRTIPSWYSRRSGAGSGLAGSRPNRINPLSSNQTRPDRVRPIRPSMGAGGKVTTPDRTTTRPVTPRPETTRPATPRPVTPRPKLTPDAEGSSSRGHQTIKESERGRTSRQPTRPTPVERPERVRPTPSQPVQRTTPSRPTIRQETQHYTDRPTTQRQSDRGASSRNSGGRDTSPRKR